MPWRLLDRAGAPLGPHVLALSGSSYMPHCTHFNVNRPVSYLLQSPPAVRVYLQNNIKVSTDIGAVRISGSALDKRAENLRAACKDERLLHLLTKDSARSLVIVNSYAEARRTYEALASGLAATGVSACYLLAEKNAKIADSNPSGTIRIQDLEDFSERPEQILIAPAAVIARGYNIVDSDGHAAITRLVFLVRPLPAPGDTAAIMRYVNGVMSARLSKVSNVPLTSIIEHAKKVRSNARRLYAELVRVSEFQTSIATLAPEQRRDLVLALFAQVRQIFGRLTRVTSDAERLATKPPREIYFWDAAWRNYKDPDGDTLLLMREYLAELVEGDELALALYEDLYLAIENMNLGGKQNDN